MKHGLKTKKNYRPVLFLCVLLAAMLCGHAFAEDEEVLDAQTTEPSNGCVFIGAEGGYADDAAEALARMNEIRYEACQEGVPDPRNPSRNLQPSDYRPLKWSEDLEKTARLRAAEAKFITEHDRHNGKKIWSADYSVWSSGEVLAWNWVDKMTPGVNQWYSEKDDWYNEVAGLDHGESGHYTAMIDPDNTYVGIAGFYSSMGLYDIAIAGRFSTTQSNVSQTMLPAYTNIIQKIDVKTEYLGDISTNIPSQIIVNETGKIRNYVVFNRNKKSFSVYYLGNIQYSSGNTSVATVDADGTIHGKKKGITTITVRANNTVIGTQTVEVVGALDIADATVTLSYQSITYSGNANINPPTVKWGTTILTEGTDYTVSYRNNVLGGTATVVVTGQGRYTGTKEAYFTIKPKTISGAYSLGSISVSLSDELKVRFQLQTNESVYNSYPDLNPYVVFTINGEVRGKVYLSDTETTVINGKLTYLPEFSVAVKEVSDTFHVEFYANDGLKNYTYYLYSVKEYLNFILENGYPAGTKALAKALLTYSAYAREYFSYETDSLTEADYPVALPNKQTVINSISGDIALSGLSNRVFFDGLSLMLLSNTGMRFYFTGDSSILAADNRIATAKNGNKYIPVSQIKIGKLATIQTVTIDGLTVTASPLQYIKNVLQYSDNQKLINLCLAMYECYQAAK